MDINEIAKKVRGREIKLFLPTKVLNPEERVAGLYVGLNIYLAKMMENVRNENRKELIEYFCETMKILILALKIFVYSVNAGCLECLLFMPFLTALIT